MKITPVDDSKAVEGTWTQYRGVQLKIARAGNEKFQKIFANLTRPYKRQIDKGTLDNDTMRNCICEALGRTILVDWKPFEVDGKTVKYTPENAVSLMEDDPDCREFVQEFANEVDNYLNEEAEEVEGKS